MIKFIATIISCCFVAATFAQHQLLIEDVTVIPMHINVALENQDVIIEDGIITTIRDHQTNDSIQYTLGRIDGRGKFLLPSFADAHAHLPEKTALKRYFFMNLLNGVTTLRSMRGEEWHLNLDKTTFTPQLLLSTPPISRRDSLSAPAAQTLLEDYKAKGFDFVKILSVKDKSTFDNLVKAAQKTGLYLAGHCPRNIGIFNVSSSKVYQSIEHLGGFLQLTSEAEINKAINTSNAENIYHCPTLDWYFINQAMFDALRNRAGIEFLPQEWIKSWEDRITDYEKETSPEKRAETRLKRKENFAYRLKILNYLYRQGSKLLVSPDASGTYGIPGYGMHTEMQHFANANISNYDILKAACYNLSEMLKTTTEWGTIMVGSKTDMILLNANPLEHISNTENINGIVLRGKFYSKEQLEKRLNELPK